MSFDDILTNIKDQLNDFLHSDWLGSLLVLIIVLAVTAGCSRVMKLFLDRVLRSDKGVVPQASIFINIGRFVIWAIGICIILSTCFGINVQAAVTALGIGGIAISLGFQSTLSNLFGGLQIVLGGIIEPGDRIKISTYEGVVHDITWRHTTITTMDGETVVVPNSLINSSALQKLHPQKDVRLTIRINDTADAAQSYAKGHSELAGQLFGGASQKSATVNTLLDSDAAASSSAAVDMVVSQDMLGVDTMVEMLEGAVDEAVQKIASLKQGSEIDVVVKDKGGYGALLSFSINEGVDEDAIEEAVSQAMEGYATIVHGATVQPANDLSDKKPQKKGLFKWTRK